MAWDSLRFRLLAGGLAAIAVALALAGAGLTMLFERHVMRTMADDLDVHLRQLIAGIDVDPAGDLVLTRPPADPRFAGVLSGLYWQVKDDRGQLLRSRSLWDVTLELPVDELAAAQAHRHVVPGPSGGTVLVLERTVLLAEGKRTLRMAVAADLARVRKASSAFARELTLALALLALVLGVATAVQVTLGLRPLAALQRAVAGVRTGSARELSSAVPSEVQPLVDELNSLLAEQEREVERSRSRAGDLAHGLKTPLAALMADVDRLKQLGQTKIAQDIEQIGAAMNRHVDRELARARMRGKGRTGSAGATDVPVLLRSLIATLERTPAGQRVRFETACEPPVMVPIDRTDLAEALGNLIDNAARHAQAKVRVSASREGGRFVITVDDDGPGIAPGMRAKALGRGIQMDERGGGAAGLGLAIVQDVMDAYGWRITLEQSALGGLRVRLEGEDTG